MACERMIKIHCSSLSTPSRIAYGIYYQSLLPASLERDFPHKGCFWTSWAAKHAFDDPPAAFSCKAPPGGAPWDGHRKWARSLRRLRREAQTSRSQLPSRIRPLVLFGGKGSLLSKGCLFFANGHAMAPFQGFIMTSLTMWLIEVAALRTDTYFLSQCDECGFTMLLMAGLAQYLNVEVSSTDFEVLRTPIC